MQGNRTIINEDIGEGVFSSHKEDDEDTKAIPPTCREIDPLPVYDVFISYKHDPDLSEVLLIAQALQGMGVKVWFDKNEISDWDRISVRIKEGLLNSKSVIVWYSQHYTESDACVLELITALVCETQHRSSRSRILVLKPEGITNPIEPMWLRDISQKTVRVVDGNQALIVAHQIAEYVSTLHGVLAPDIGESTRVFDGQRVGDLPAHIPYGRLEQLLNIFDALHGADLAFASKQISEQPVLISGLFGIGKTFLVRAYIALFSVLYEGRTYSLDAGCRAYPGELKGVFNAKDQLEAQLLRIAVDLGLPPEVTAIDEAQNFLKRHLTDIRRPYLWVVTNIPSDAVEEFYAAWAAPTRNGRTIFTCDTRLEAFSGKSIELDGLGSREIERLLLNNLDDVRLSKDNLSALVELASGLPGLAASLVKSVSLWGVDATIARFRGAAKTNTWYSPYRHLISALDARAKELLAAAIHLGPGELPLRFFSVLAKNKRAENQAIIALDECSRVGLIEKPKQGRIRLAPVLRGLVKYDPDLGPWFSDGKNSAVIALVQVLPETTGFRFFDNDFEADILLLYPPAANLCEQIPDEATALLLQRVGVFRLMIGDKEKYQECFRQSYDWFKSHSGEEAPATILALKEYASTFKGQEDEYVWCQKLVDTARNALVPEDPLLLRILHYQSIVLGDSGKTKEAEQIARKVFEAQKKILGPGHLDTLGTGNSLGLFVALNDNSQAALEMLQQVFAGADQALSPSHPLRLRIMSNLAKYLEEEGQPEEALTMKIEVLRYQEANLGKLHPLTFWAAVNLHSLYVNYQFWKEAQGVLETYLQWVFEPAPISAMALQHQELKAKLEKDAMGFFKMYSRPDWYGFPPPRDSDDVFTRAEYFITSARIILGVESEEFCMVLGDALNAARRQRNIAFIERLSALFPDWTRRLQQVKKRSRHQRIALKEISRIVRPSFTSRVFRKLGAILRKTGGSRKELN